LRMASAMIDRAELPVHRKRTLNGRSGGECRSLMVGSYPPYATES
jgi:hypothetical protein